MTIFPCYDIKFLEGKDFYTFSCESLISRIMASP